MAGTVSRARATCRCCCIMEVAWGRVGSTGSVALGCVPWRLPTIKRATTQLANEKSPSLRRNSPATSVGVYLRHTVQAPKP